MISAFHFPLDLERIIFEQAAFRNHQTALQLIRVSKSVCHWVEPSIYEYIPTSKTLDFLKTLADSSISKPTEFYALHVKAICISMTVETAPASILFTILTTFTNLESIALWHSWDDGDNTLCKDMVQKAAIGKLIRPKRFSCDIEHFFAIHDIPQRQPDFSAPFFSRLTHLEILDTTYTWTSWTGLELLPCLTHLNIDANFENVFDIDNPGVMPCIARILKLCQTLEIILFMSLYDRQPSYSRKELEDIMSSCYDPRIVVLPAPIYIEDWDASFKGESDMWSKAEEKAKEQRIEFQRNLDG